MGNREYLKQAGRNAMKPSFMYPQSRPKTIILAQLLAFLASGFMLCVPAIAQGETTSAIVGSVIDPAGAAIAGAAITVTNTETGLKRSVKTDETGRFSFPQLMPGTYSVKAEAVRFEPQQNNSVSAGLGQKQTVDFKLQHCIRQPKHSSRRSRRRWSTRRIPIHRPP